MKLSKVAKLCKDRMSIMIVDKVGDDTELTQWIGTPEAMYPLYNLPEIDEKTIFVIFDVDDKKKTDYSVNRIDKSECPLSLEETDATELPIEPSHYQIVAESHVYLIFDTSKGIRFVNRAYLAPMMSKLDQLMFFERKTKTGQLYIVAKLGMLLAGVIVAPAPNASDGRLLNFSKRLYEGIEVARRHTEADAKERVFVDPETGEVMEDKA